MKESGSAAHQSDYYPFGLEMPGRVRTLDAPRERYTGHEIETLGTNTTWYYAGARMYDPVVARWMTTDPLAEKFPGWSPYNYVLGNPVLFVDPDGMEVRCKTREECQTAADELNAVHDGETGITVEETEWEVRNFWGKKKTVSGFRLSTAESDFDWSQGEYTPALFDVINNQGVVFDLQIVDESFRMPRTPWTAEQIQGRNYAGPGGGRVIVGRSNEHREPVGVVLMHELVGHGHPDGGGRANDVNDYYQSRLGYKLAKAKTENRSHGGYLRKIGFRPLRCMRYTRPIPLQQ